ncbi:5-formyltetrahydrofolate cyclo-ligase [Fulvivirga ligni]|uniref:5-formyltetrahydrofolate cyclo-ligase n=1 Tax=Fulvivirga ligni TaxID=2904246 RepID=UPI001F3D85AE|nr:5-formyltetrahydrofolate cyclo-ligase [Fulvivirga ligni]UII21937.1 5-formyltetrahydrofolate cyclo-ligase [Fulvivirga ligni]
MIDKNTLRKVYLQKRLALSSTEFEKRNKLLVQNFSLFLKDHQFEAAHSFLSIVDKNEVDTLSLISVMKDQGVSKVAISKSLPQGELEHYWYDDDLILQTSKWGIPEPEQGKLADIYELDMVLVPLISFDRSGHRIGYGKGYYDRFLSKIPEVLKVGVSLGPPLDQIPFSGTHDIPLNICITPFSVYYFKK